MYFLTDVNQLKNPDNLLRCTCGAKSIMKLKLGEDIDNTRKTVRNILFFWYGRRYNYTRTKNSQTGKMKFKLITEVLIF